MVAALVVTARALCLPHLPQQKTEGRGCFVKLKAIKRTHYTASPILCSTGTTKNLYDIMFNT